MRDKNSLPCCTVRKSAQPLSGISICIADGLQHTTGWTDGRLIILHNTQL